MPGVRRSIDCSPWVSYEQGKTAEEIATELRRIEAHCAKLFAKTDARFWIESRNIDWRVMAKRANAEG